jgi:hypothetical protein
MLAGMAKPLAAPVLPCYKSLNKTMMKAEQ